MKMYDPRRADSRTFPEKLVGLIMAADEDDLRAAQEHINKLAQGRPKLRPAFVRLIPEATK